MKVYADFIRKSGITRDFVPIEHSDHPGFYIVPGFDRLLVNRVGDLLERKKKRVEFEPREWITKGDSARISYTAENPNGTSWPIIINKIVLLAVMFTPRPAEFPHCQVTNIDGDLNNNELSNLRLVPTNGVISNTVERVKEACKALLEDPVVPLKDHSEYYRIPGFPAYAIHPTTCEILSGKRFREAVPVKIRKLQKGYRVELCSQDNLKIIFSLQVILASMFLREDRISQDQTEVVFKNEDVYDLRLSNLSWVTPKKTEASNVPSIKKSLQKHLANDIREPIIPIDVFNTTSKKLARFGSAAECSSAFNLNADQMFARLTSGEKTTWPEGNRYMRAILPDSWDAISSPIIP